MEYSQETHIDNVVASIQARIKAPRSGEKLEKDAVESIDIVHHGLVFTRHERGMELWRSALWEQRLEPEAEQSLRAMLVYLLAAVARGEIEEVSKICDCLHEIMPPPEVLQPVSGSAERI
ncbi:MAG: hypothetical protein ABI165_07345 [Bryobacteraceae bacterium]